MHIFVLKPAIVSKVGGFTIYVVAKGTGAI